MLHALDRTTLQIVTVLVSVCSLVLLLNIWRVNRREPGPAWWVLSALLSVIAFVVMALVKLQGLPVGIAVVLSSTLSLATLCCTLEGILRFRGYQDPQRWRWIPRALPLFIVLAFLNRNDPVNRHLMHDALAALILGAQALVLLRRPPAEERPGLLFAASVSLMMAGVFAWRWWLAVQAMQGQDLASHPNQKLVLLAAVVYSIGWVYATSLLCYERAQARFIQLAHEDGLTGLPNRRHFETQLRIEAARSARTDESFGLALLDLNGFKQINDVHGHAAGDALLVEVARRLQEVARGSDLVARLGGDEFVVLMPGLRDPADLTALRERLRGSVDGPVHWSGLGLYIASSIGMAAWGADGRDTARLLEIADTRMYEDKSRHRGSPFQDAAGASHTRDAKGLSAQWDPA